MQGHPPALIERAVAVRAFCRSCEDPRPTGAIDAGLAERARCRRQGRAGFRSLKDTWADTTTPHGRLMLTVLGGLAEFERELIRARTGEGRKRAQARDKNASETSISHLPRKCCDTSLPAVTSGRLSEKYAPPSMPHAVDLRVPSDPSRTGMWSALQPGSKTRATIEIGNIRPMPSHAGKPAQRNEFLRGSLQRLYQLACARCCARSDRKNVLIAI
jgi:hypothetical protein